VTAPLVPGWLLAAETRKAVERHTRWDAPHHFATLHWDGKNLYEGTHVVIIPDVCPDDYPLMMATTAARRVAEHPADPPVAYLLQIESHGVTEPGPGATRAERAGFDAARRWRTFYQQPDAVEVCVAWCADTDGRLWAAEKRRDDPAGAIHQQMYTADDIERVGGQMIEALFMLGGASARRARAAHPEARRGRA
jgi:hypothetical protein